MEAFIVDGCRTAIARGRGRLAQSHPADIGAVVVDALVDRNSLDPSLVDDVIFASVTQTGAQSANVARNVVLSSKLPITVPGVTIDRQGGSGLQVVQFAAQAVMSGVQDVVIAGGTEMMTMVPIGANVLDGIKMGHGNPWGSRGIKERFQRDMFDQFRAAELMAKRGGVTRDELDDLAFRSHRNAARAACSGFFRNEIVPMPGVDRKTGKPTTHATDEGIRFNADREKMRRLKPLARGGLTTAGNASQVSDGAAAVLICNRRGLAKLGLRPRARILSMGLAGTDPDLMLYGPVPSTRKALAQVGLCVRDIDLFEVNEAFASVPVVWQKELKVPSSKLNVHGGAISLGHALGGTGTRMLVTLINALEIYDKRLGLATICAGGGTGNAMIVERCKPALSPARSKL